MHNVIALLFFTLLVINITQAAQETKNLGEVNLVQNDESALIKTISIDMDFSVLNTKETAEIIFPFPDKTLVIKVKPVAGNRLGLPQGQFAWIGYSEDTDDVFIMRIGKAFEATVQFAGKVYQLHSMDGKKAKVEIFDASKFREPPNDGVVDPRDNTKEDINGDSSCEDPSNEIDVMVLFTPAARDAAGSVTQIENEIAFAVGRANLAYMNSSVAHRLNLVYTGVVAFTEPVGGVDSNALLGNLAGTSDGVLDSVHSLRDSVQADLVSLFYETDDSSWCGWGQTQEVANADTTDHRAFTVVQRSCAGGYLSFAHEVGHNMGAQHDDANVSGATLLYNRGHIQPEPNMTTVSPWRTVLSYSDPCATIAGESCTRLPYFSNPDVDYFTDATGVTEAEDNVRVFENNDSEVSRYRCLRDGTSGPNVWMKDRWEDQGNEPDPATVGKAMWQSPYIWIRRTEDTTLEHEHEHENPLLSITNYVYVKLHNTGNMSESSNLELYYASASTNLNDPGNWNLIDSQPLTISPGTGVATFEWSSLPGEGHYCLLARWNIDGIPLAFSDINDAVRGDNDLIWRNVNIVGMGDGDSSYHFIMEGDRRLEESYLLITTRPISNMKINWQKLATETISIDPSVLNLNNLRVENLEQISESEFTIPLNSEAKLVGPFVLKPTQQTTVKLATLVDEEAVKKLSVQLANPVYYDIAVIQIHSKAVDIALQDPSQLYATPGLVIGGVNYTLTVPANQ